MPVVCDGCGRENPSGSSYCNWCGAGIGAAIGTRAVNEKVCPSCGTRNPSVASFCQNCTRDFSQRDPQSRSEGPRYTGRACWSCGSHVDPWAEYCTTCGARLSTAALETPLSSGKSNLPLYASVMFAGSGVLALVSAARVLSTEGYLEEYGIDVSGFLDICGALMVIFAFCSLVASFSSYRRGSFAIVLVAGTMGMLGIGPFYLGSLLALIGVILVAASRDEFR